ncbi:DUF4012 domain-containing protein [Dactylosporangium sp. NBC_01737]|uniref:DUF4012 domain-containing protein n=1 Tax=Dactylosporangium sp. NBC_01737 TaxID=2975959 RepID=UPI002E0D8926|nr:DUF4012 domain-containing protein [Dactylosporangium sp. NBC_01737]
MTGRLLRTVERRHRMLAALVPLTLVPIAVVGGLGGHAARTYTHLRRAAELTTMLQHAVVGAEADQARTLAAALRRETAAARQEVGGPGWRAGTRLPGLGADLAAVTDVVTALDQVATDVLPAVLDTAHRLTGAALPGGLTAGGSLDQAEAAARQASARVARIDPDALLPQLRAPVRTVQHQLDRAAGMVSAGAALLRVLPAVLGAARPRTWLVLFQNPAELRATGGMPGAWMVVRFAGGALSIVEQGNANMTRPFDAPVLPLDPQLKALYGDRIGRFPANVNLTPDFPTAAALAAEMHRRRGGSPVDGVIALDPVALSYLLRATGPVTFRAGAGADGRLSSANAVRLLLSDAYARPGSPTEKNDYFADAARAVFDTVVSGRLDPRAALSAVLQMAQERRLLLWSAHPDEQAQIERLPVAGRLPLRDEAGPNVGIFLNDGSGAKLNYYLRTAVTLTPVACATERSRRMLRVETTFTSQVPPSGLPAYVLGLGLAGDPYTMRLNVSVFAPTGGGLAEARLDGRQVTVASGFERARQVSMATVDIAPGATRTLVALLDAGNTEGRQTQALTPQLWTTPTVNGWTIRTAPAPETSHGTSQAPVTSAC